MASPLSPTGLGPFGELGVFGGSDSFPRPGSFAGPGNIAAPSSIVSSTSDIATPSDTATPSSIATPSDMAASSQQVRLQQQGGGFANLPSCAVPCMSEHCTSLDTACLCAPHKGDLDTCILASCTAPEAIFSRNVTETTCQTAVRNRSTKFNVMILTMAGFTVPIVLLRLVFKQFFSVQQRLNSEDWTIIVAIPLGLPSIAITIFGLTANGLGKDTWGLTPDDLVAFGYYFYVMQMFYVLLMMIVKLTLTFFYMNIFTGRIMTKVLWATVVAQIITAIGFVIGIVFQCRPIGYQWKRYYFSNTNPVHGQCLDINAAGWTNGAINIASDFWLLAIPLSQLHKLKLHWKKRLGATLMFLTGAIVTVISFLRLASIRKYASTSNPTWDQWDITWWSTIEVQVGLICTCLPAIRLILVRIAPRIFGTEFESCPRARLRRMSKAWRARHQEKEDDASAILHRKMSASGNASPQHSPRPDHPRQPEPAHQGHPRRTAFV